MLAWLIVISSIDLLLIIAYCYVIVELNKYRKETDKMLKFDPLEHGRRHHLYSYGNKNNSNPYDSTPVFIQGIKQMVSDIDQLYSLNRTHPDNDDFGELEDRVDKIADDVGGLFNKCDENESDISKVRSSMWANVSEFDSRVDEIDDSITLIDKRLHHLEYKPEEKQEDKPEPAADDSQK